MSGPTLDSILDQFADAVAARVADRLAEHGGELSRSGLRCKRSQDREPDFLSEIEVSRRTGLSRRTLQGWRAGGRGPKYVKTGRRVLYPAFELKDFLSPRKVLNGGVARCERETSHR